MPLRSKVRSTLCLVGIICSGCTEDVETTYLQFNSEGESLTVYVGDSSLLKSEETIELMSTTGSVVVGTATVTPLGGPVGTEHQLSVAVSDDYEDEVTRVTVRTNSGDRGEDEYELEGDSADEGFWKIALVSAGEPDEVREDTFTIRLWEVSGTTTSSDAGDTAQ